MTTIRNFYEKEVEGQWDGVMIPELTAVEAQRAAQRLWRKVFKRKLLMPIKITSGRSHTYILDRVVRVNPEKGWKDVVHGLSHSFYARMAPGKKPHDRPHGAMERMMIRHVIDSGWLEGKLKPKVKVVVKVDPKALKLSRLKIRKDNWERKQSRAQRAIVKLNRSISAMERYAHKRNQHGSDNN